MTVMCFILWLPTYPRPNTVKNRKDLSRMHPQLYPPLLIQEFDVLSDSSRILLYLVTEPSLP